MASFLRGLAIEAVDDPPTTPLYYDKIHKIWTPMGYCTHSKDVGYGLGPLGT
jgi:hypothetical protein